jgi:DNA-binding transcriptional MocR family regulator
MRVLYCERRTVLVDSIAKEFGSGLEVLGAQAGMHLAVTLPKGFLDQEVATSAARKGFWLYLCRLRMLGKIPARDSFSGLAIRAQPRSLTRSIN